MGDEAEKAGGRAGQSAEPSTPFSANDKKSKLGSSAQGSPTCVCHRAEQRMQAYQGAFASYSWVFVVGLCLLRSFPISQQECVKAQRSAPHFHKQDNRGCFQSPPFWFLMEWFFSWPQRREEGPSGRWNQDVDEGARDLLWTVQRNTRIYKRAPFPTSRESLQKYFSAQKLHV